MAPTALGKIKVCPITAVGARYIPGILTLFFYCSKAAVISAYTFNKPDISAFCTNLLDINCFSARGLYNPSVEPYRKNYQVLQNSANYAKICADVSEELL